jgi:hypothetical protein
MMAGFEAVLSRLTGELEKKQVERRQMESAYQSRNKIQEEHLKQAYEDMEIQIQKVAKHIKHLSFLCFFLIILFFYFIVHCTLFIVHSNYFLNRNEKQFGKRKSANTKKLNVS